MITPPLTLSERDRTQLLDAIERARSSWRLCAPYVQVLRERVLSARIVPLSELPDDCVRIGDRVRLRHARPEFRETLRLVLPSAYASDEATLSVISPLGVELLGAQAGQTVYWLADDGPRRTVVEAILRPRIHREMPDQGDQTPPSDPASAERRYWAVSKLTSC